MGVVKQEGMASISGWSWGVGCVRFIQRHKTSRVCVCVCARACVHAHMHANSLSHRIWYITCDKELAYVIQEAEKSPDLQSKSQRPRNVNDVSPTLSWQCGDVSVLVLKQEKS